MRSQPLTLLTLAPLLLWTGPPAAADTKADVVRTEQAKLQGTWQLLSAETDGKQVPQEQVKKVKVVITGDRHTVYVGDQAVAKAVRFAIDPTRTPRAVDDTLEDGRVIRGIYELDGDTLRSCVAAVGKERPTAFTARAGSGQTLRVFRRVPADEAGPPGAGDKPRAVVVPRDDKPFTVGEKDVVRLTARGIAGSKIEAAVVAGPARIEGANDVSERANGSPVLVLQRGFGAE
jgi:uncharacterized protein (TIGR03067 family)